jgi:PIN domain nuclease of toxin-antitoxin system
MRGLLDTHTALWFFHADKRLSARAKSFMFDKANTLYISVVSLWEVAIKTGLGKLDFPGRSARFLELIERYDYSLLGVLPRYILELEKLASHHKDPFDRLLVASAIAENMPIIHGRRKHPVISC